MMDASEKPCPPCFFSLFVFLFLHLGTPVISAFLFTHWSPVCSPHKGQGRIIGIFFDLRLNKRLSNQSRRNWFEMRIHRAHHDVTLMALGVNPVNTFRPRQNGRHFPDDSFKWIFLNENVWISIEVSLKFVPKGPINNIPALVQIMAWRRPGDKPLSEPMIVSLLTHNMPHSASMS